MKSLILHIGRHKSGTSSLQHFLSDNQELLKSQGWLYPSSMRAKQPAHHDLARVFNPNQFNKASKHEQSKLRVQLNDFRDEVEHHDNVIVSSENFQNLMPATLVEEFAGVELVVVVYLREIVSYFLSSYAQAIKANKLTMSPQEYEEKIFRAKYYTHIRLWQNAFPQANFVVRLFKREHLEAGDIRLDFVRATGLSEKCDLSKAIFRQHDENPSITGELLEFKRFINAYPFEAVINPKNLYSILNEIALYQASKEHKTTVTTRLKQSLLSRYREEAEKTEKQFNLGRNVLFDHSFPEENSRLDSIESFEKICDLIDLVKPGLGSQLLKIRYKTALIR